MFILLISFTLSLFGWIFSVIWGILLLISGWGIITSFLLFESSITLFSISCFISGSFWLFSTTLLTLFGISLIFSTLSVLLISNKLLLFCCGGMLLIILLFSITTLLLLGSWGIFWITGSWGTSILLFMGGLNISFSNKLLFKGLFIFSWAFSILFSSTFNFSFASCSLILFILFILSKFWFWLAILFISSTGFISFGSSLTLFCGKGLLSLLSLKSLNKLLFKLIFFSPKISFVSSSNKFFVFGFGFSSLKLNKSFIIFLLFSSLFSSLLIILSSENISIFGGIYALALNSSLSLLIFSSVLSSPKANCIFFGFFFLTTTVFSFFFSSCFS